MENIRYLSRILTGGENVNISSFVAECIDNASQSNTNYTGTSLNCTIPSQYNNGTSNLTVVTAYWKLGTFRKGSYGNLRISKNHYFQWASVFKYLVNPVVVYTDSEEFRVLMEELRPLRTYKTKIFLVNRTAIWSFQLTDKIKTVFEQPGYPTYRPNTVYPEYSAAQHAKYDVIADSVRKGFFKTPYYAWLDVGYFRDIVNREHFFRLDIPPGFDPERISFNLISERPMDTEPSVIFRKNHVWVGGGMFLGTENVILQFAQLYQRAVLYFLDQNLMNSDQQVLFSLYSHMGRKALKPDVELQIYTPTGKGNIWFYLGYLCRKEVSLLNQ